MRITEEQFAILNSFSCVRLSSNEQHLRDVESFYNSRNDNLVQTLLNEAYEEDANNRIAYYLIKDCDNHILFYFSLKCGQLYDKHLDFGRYKQLSELYGSLLKMKKEQDTSKEDIKIIDELLEDIRARKGVIKSNLQKISKKNKTVEEFEQLFIDGTEKVGATFGGIEIVQFCANEGCRQYWERYEFDQKLGVVVFWHFLVPIILSIIQRVGCQYIFLFAADNTEDEDLINYYKGWLNFQDSEERTTATPIYDITCKFLYQETCSLIEKQQVFYDNFNHDNDVV